MGVEEDPILRLDLPPPPPARSALRRARTVTRVHWEAPEGRKCTLRERQFPWPLLLLSPSRFQPSRPWVLALPAPSSGYRSRWPRFASKEAEVEVRFLTPTPPEDLKAATFRRKQKKKHFRSSGTYCVRSPCALQNT